jgi:acetyl-CoA carboxylase biotin carboxyl carrier protein
VAIDRDGLTRVLQAFDQEDWDEVHLIADGVEVHLAASQPGSAGATTSHVSSGNGTRTTPATAPVEAPSVPSQPSAGTRPVVTDGAPVDEVVAPSPGIFWRSPSPGAPPFAEVGMRVDADAVLCIVEIMKLMNTITAPRPGAVVEVLVGNGEQVERGQALFRIRPDGA